MQRSLFARASAAFLLFALLLPACGGSDSGTPGPQDARADGGARVDASARTDASMITDAEEPVPDGATLDAAAADSTLADAATLDAVAPDAPTTDAVAPDAITRDAMTPDAITRDAMTPDAMTRDAMTPDAITRDAMPPDAMTRDATAPDSTPFDSGPTDSFIRDRGFPDSAGPLDARTDGAVDGGASDVSTADSGMPGVCVFEGTYGADLMGMVVYFRFNADGTWVGATSRAALDTMPVARGVYSYGRGILFINDTSATGCAPTDRGEYVVTFTAGCDAFTLALTQDPCRIRSDALNGATFQM